MTMRRIYLLLIVTTFFSETSGQAKYSYAKIDSLVAGIKANQNLVNKLDTGTISLHTGVGFYRECYVVDPATQAVYAFTSSVMVNSNLRSSVANYYYDNNRLIKVELYDSNAGYKRSNVKYLYFSDEDWPGRKKDAEYYKIELLKVRHLRLGTKYLAEYTSR